MSIPLSSGATWEGREKGLPGTRLTLVCGVVRQAPERQQTGTTTLSLQGSLTLLGHICDLLHDAWSRNFHPVSRKVILHPRLISHRTNLPVDRSDFD